MKKIAIFILAIMPLGIFAQSGPYFGISGAVYNSWVINQQDYGNPIIPTFDYEPTVGTSFGAIGGYKFSDNVGLQLEFRYTRIGQDYERQDGNLVLTRELELTYMQFPLLFKLNGGLDGDFVRFYTLIGPTMGILTRSRDHFSPDPTFSSPVNRRDDINNIDLQGTLEFGAEFYIVAGLYANLGLRLNMSIMDINDERHHDQNNYKSSRNANWGTHIGINYILAN